MLKPIMPRQKRGHEAICEAWQNDFRFADDTIGIGTEACARYE
jgi:hypothetical protein